MKLSKKIFSKILLGVFVTFVATSCNQAKYLLENEYLLTQNNIVIDSKQIKKSDLEPYIQQKPNRTTLEFLRWHLYIYNISHTKKENKTLKWFGIYKLGEIIGEPPVIIDSSLVEKTKIQFRKFLESKGYWNSIVYDSIVYKNKRAIANYKIKTNAPYIYNKVNYSFLDFGIKNTILSDTTNSLIKPNKLLDFDNLEKERNRITTLLQDSGYYYFNEDYIHYEIDSALNTNKADIIIVIEKALENITDKDVIETEHKQYKINSTKIITDYNLIDAIKFKDNYLTQFDSTTYKNIKFYTTPITLVSTKAISRHIYIAENENYNLSRVKETYKHLSTLGAYKIVNIKFTETKEKDNYLDCIIQLTPFNSQSYTTEIEGTNSAGNLGVAGSFQYQHKSFFTGAEQFSSKIKGGIEAQSSLNTSDNTLIPFNAKEISVETSINFPVFLLPIYGNKFVRHNIPKTIVSFVFNYQNRPDYEKTFTTASFGYLWKSVNFSKHNFNLIEISAITAPFKSELFITEVLNKNIGLKRSFENQFVTATNYGVSFSNQNTKKNTSYIQLRLFSESSGNILNAYSQLVNKSKTEVYKIFGEKFSQYLKLEADFRIHHILNKSNNVVYRLYGGFGLPYGNAEVLPYEKQFFSGGANGLRAWQIRTLGPGAYFNENIYSIYQTSDVKLEGNLEYRYKLFWVIEGAFFTDAGNIWAINKLEENEDAKFKIDNFYNQLAIDGGMGLRFDFSFLILRFDYGFKLRDPKEILGNRWLLFQPNYKPFNSNNGLFNFSIGYPF